MNLDVIRYAGIVQLSRISKVAGVGLIGFVVAAGLADKANLTPTIAQLTGFAGAFIGSLVANRRTARRPEQGEPADKSATERDPSGE